MINTTEITPSQEGAPDTVIPDNFNRVTEREAEVLGRINTLGNLPEGLLNGLPEERKGFFRNLSERAHNNAVKSLTRAVGITALGFALNSQALAEKQSTEKALELPTATATIEQAKVMAEVLKGIAESKIEATKKDIGVLTSQDADGEKRFDASLSILTKPPLLGSIIEKKIPGLMVINDINTIKNEINERSQREINKESIQESNDVPKDGNDDSTSIGKLQQRIKILEDTDATLQKKLDSTVGIATDTPVISKVLRKQTPYLSFIEAANQLMKDINDPKKSKEDVAKNLGRIIFDAKTLGLGSFVIDLLSESEQKIDTGTRDQNRQEISR